MSNGFIIHFCNAKQKLQKNIMYQGKREILNPDEYEARRKKCIEYKADATATAFSELEDILNKSQLARQYFGKSQSWFSQRVNGCAVLNKAMAFKEDEFRCLTAAFRDIARRLTALADDIDAAKMG